MGISKEIGRRLAPQAHKLAPGLTTQFVHESLQRALDGVGPLPPAAEAADKQLAEQGGDIERAVHEVIENHVRYAGAQGFVTNLGGLATLAVALPANIVGLTLLQCRMVAGIAHLRGYDLDDPRVHNAVLACILGEDKVRSLIRKKMIPAPPMAIATAPAHDPHLDRLMAAEVGDEALRAGVADVVLDHLVHGAVDVAALLGELLVGRLGGGGQRADPVERALERLVDELRGEPRRELVRLRREPSPDLLADPHATPSGAFLLMPTLASGTQPGGCCRAQ